MNQVKDQFTRHIQSLQATICKGLEEADGQAKFAADVWERPGGGQGNSRVISGGNVFEKGGVNTSVVLGELSPQAAQQLKVQGKSFFACGLSLVLHPFNPFVPTVHANWRYFELYDGAENVVDAWFGGGSDLTPYYLFEDDVTHFHGTQKASCDAFDSVLYPKFKKQCDNYFSNHHRGEERRGVGGIFYDHCRAEDNHDLEFWMHFSKANGNVFLDGYLPIVNRRRNMPFSSHHKYWQEIRRGRYVEFNLLHDRGTLFGLKTQGRTESILMSLPPTVRFDYQYQPPANGEEEKLLRILREPVDWV